MASFTSTPSDKLAKILIPVFLALCSWGIELLIPKAAMILQGSTTVIPLNWNQRLYCAYFELIRPGSTKF